MRTTAGVTASARFTNASLRSAAGFTASVETRCAVSTTGIAFDALVQPMPLASPSPKRKAITV